MDLTFPLTTYLQGQTLQYLLIVTPVTGSPVAGPWRNWDLAALGNVVGVTSDQLP